MDIRSVWMKTKAKAIAGSAAKSILAACLASAAMLGGVGIATAATVEVKLIQTPAGKTYFDPVGAHIAPGDTIRWAQVSGFHSITAYHPGNDRISEAGP